MINTSIVTTVLLCSLLVCAVIIVFTRKLINAVIYMGAFSTLAALVFLLLGAPDVALAEAVIGSTISTIIYLIAIKKYRMFVVYIINNKNNDEIMNNSIKQLLKSFEGYLKENEMQLHIINTNDTVESLSLREDHSLIIENDEKNITVHSECQSLHTDNIVEIIAKTILSADIAIDCQNISHLLPYSQEEEDEMA